MEPANKMQAAGISLWPSICADLQVLQAERPSGCSSGCTREESPLLRSPCAAGAWHEACKQHAGI